MKKVNILLEGPKELSRMEKERKTSFIPRPFFIVTTVSKEIADAELKTNFTIVSSLDRVVFVCSKDQDTDKNILDTKEFAVDVPTEEIVDQTFMTGIPFLHGVNKIENTYSWKGVWTHGKNEEFPKIIRG